MPRFPKARWDGPIPNENPGSITRPILGLVLHVEQGTENGTNSWFHNPKAEASAHFGNPKIGPLDQWVDTSDKAWAEVAGNSRWISVEHEGQSTDKITAGQIENDAQLLAWLHVTEGVPLQITNSVNKPGLGWHGMGGAGWGGHYDCPGPSIKAARKQIIARAKQIVGTKTAKPYSKVNAALIRRVTAVLTKRAATDVPLDTGSHTITDQLIKAAEAVEAIK